MKSILVTGAGGRAAVNLIRFLHLGSDEFHIIGFDSDKHCSQRVETDEYHLVPNDREPDY